jgi:mutator protein MutT
MPSDSIPSGRPRLDVTAAVIRRGGEILVAQRPPGSRHAGRWEFPGGKREPDETLAACLIREIDEELGLEIDGLVLMGFVDHDEPDLRLRLHAFVCRPVNGRDPIRGLFAWLPLDGLNALDLLPPDRVIAQWLDPDQNKAEGPLS